MRYKSFGTTGLDLSVLTIGTYAVGNPAWGDTGEGDFIDAIRYMVEHGVNHVDTAVNYGGGESERIVGRAIKDFREKLIVTTKGGFVRKDGKMVKDCSRANMLRSCDESLRNLGLDYIDIYMVHQVDPTVPFGETMEALNTLKAQGKIRHIALSNCTRQQMEECRKYADVEAVQLRYSMVDRGKEADLKWAKANGIGTMTHGSMGAGILSGAYRTLPNFPANDARVLYYDYFKEPKFSRIMEFLKTLDEVAGAHDAPVAQVVLNWQSQKAYLDTALIGVRNVPEAVENCGGFDWTLTDEEAAAIDAAIEQYLNW